MMLISPPLGEAATPRVSSQDLTTLQSCVTLLNESVLLSEEAALVTKKRLSDKYDLTLGEVDGLLNLKLKYGELAAVLTFAKKMSGGVNDSNINKVIELRNSGLEWDQIAEQLHLNLSGIARSLNRFEEGTHSEIKKALTEYGVTGTAAGGTDASGR